MAEKDNRSEQEIVAAQARVRDLTEGLKGSSTVYYPETDQVGFAGSETRVDCSNLRRPDIGDAITGNARMLTDLLAPLPDPSAGISTDTVRQVAEDRISLREASVNNGNKGIKSCGPGG